MKRFVRLGLGGVVSAMILLTGCSQKSTAELVASARTYLESGNLSSAGIELRAALQQSPDFGEARFLLGVLLLEQGLFGHAVIEFEKARELKFDETKVSPRLARALLSAGRSKEVVSRFESTQLQDPDARAELFTAVGIALIEQGQVAKGEAKIEEALQAQPQDDWALLTKARVQAGKGRIESGLQLAESVIKGGRNSGEAWYLKGLFLQLPGPTRNPQLAEAAFKEAMKDKRQQTAARIALVEIYMADQRMPELKALRDDLRKSDPKSSFAQMVDAQIAYIEGRLEDSRQALDALLRVSSNNARLLTFSGTVDLARGAFLSAETQLGKAVNLPDAPPTARRLLAQTYLRLGEPQKAVVALHPQLTGAQADAESLALAGEASLQMGDARRAEQHFIEAVRLKPDDARLRTAVALTDLARGSAAEGFAALNEIARSDPGEVADRALVSAHLRRGEFEPALTAVRRLEAKAADKTGVEILRGVVLRAKGDLTGARAAFEAVLRLQPTHYVAISNLAELDLGSGDIESARRRLEAAAKSNPRNVEPRLALLRLMGSSGATPDAIKTAIEGVASAFPGEAEPRLMLVTHLLTSGNAQGGLVVAQQADAAFPGRADVLDALGRAQADAGNLEQAISTFGKAAALNPRSPLAYMRLADLQARRRDFSGAGVSLRKAFDVAPDLEEIHGRMVHLARMTKSPAVPMAAAADLKRRFPDSPLGDLVEGDVHAMLKNWPAALSAYRAGLPKKDPRSRSVIRVYNAMAASGQRAAAERFADEWIDSRPADVAFIRHVGERAMSDKDAARAERLFQKAVAIDKSSPVVFNNLAWLQAQRGSKDAVINAEKAVALAPASPFVLDTLATALASQKQFARAVEVQQRAMSLAPADDNLRLNLAQIYVAAGDREKATIELDKLAALGDRFPGQAIVQGLKLSLAKR